ncbi:MAG: hypothetical protein F6J90_27490 [Moorea sp. SIOASIH]|uniref:hypothetical protein n=1 Tax=Moorena sp. SIOASIH TaxID=2607817 RepID=UPI0013BC6C81|nr:hypothetical protein [Moorena sp. SIOASIH]NEO39874.1 hypothetical protein [Moorena sp. SIOASIH]NEO97064.1 hypothetical protein [Moorena sp. SIO3G5]
MSLWLTLLEVPSANQRVVNQLGGAGTAGLKSLLVLLIRPRAVIAPASTSSSVGVALIADS